MDKTDFLFLCKKFAKTNKTVPKEEPKHTYYGTVKKDINNNISVILDTSDSELPVLEASGAENGDRVTVEIHNNEAIIVGNFTAPPSSRTATSYIQHTEDGLYIGELDKDGKPKVNETGSLIKPGEYDIVKMVDINGTKKPVTIGSFKKSLVDPESSEIILGQEDKEHVKIDNDEFKIIDKKNHERLNVLNERAQFKFVPIGLENPPKNILEIDGMGISAWHYDNYNDKEDYTTDHNRFSLDSNRLQIGFNPEIDDTYDPTIQIGKKFSIGAINNPSLSHFSEITSYMNPLHINSIDESVEISSNENLLNISESSIKLNGSNSGMQSPNILLNVTNLEKETSSTIEISDSQMLIHDQRNITEGSVTKVETNVSNILTGNDIMFIDKKVTINLSLPDLDKLPAVIFDVDTSSDIITGYKQVALTKMITNMAHYMSFAGYQIKDSSINLRYSNWRKLPSDKTEFVVWLTIMCIKIKNETTTETI